MTLRATTAVLLAALGIEALALPNCGVYRHDYVRPAAASNYASSQSDTASNYPLNLELCGPDVKKALETNPAAFPDNMIPEDFRFRYVTPPIRYGQEERSGDVSDYRKQPVIRALGHHMDSLDASSGLVRNWNMDIIPDDSLSSYGILPPGIRPKYEDPTTPESRANSALMRRLIEKSIGRLNFMRARDAEERHESVGRLLGRYDPDSGLVKFAGTMIGPGCEPCRYFVFTPSEPQK